MKNFFQGPRRVVWERVGERYVAFRGGPFHCERSEVFVNTYKLV